MTRAQTLRLSTFAVLAFFSGLAANAQSPFDDALFSFSLFPQYPHSRSTAEIEIVGYITDLTRADIAWYVNGGLKKSGIGERKFVFETGAVGTATEIDMVMKQTNGFVVRKSITIRPADIDFIWEAEGYAPPFYRGKINFVDGSRVRVIALPSMTDKEGRRLSAQNLIYQWEQDGRLAQAASGFGRNVYTFIKRRALLTSATVGVEISSVDGGVTSKGETALIPAPMAVALYEKNPLYGSLWNNVLAGETTLKNSEITLEATPYFASATGRFPGPLTYEWTINNELVGEGRPEITLRKPPDGAGASNIKVVVKHPKYWAQNVAAELFINFSR